MSYEQRAYEYVPSNHKRRPLMIASSGGGGHIAAIQGIQGFLEQEFGNDIILPEYSSILYEDKPFSSRGLQVEIGLLVLNLFLIGSMLKTVLEYTPIPVLPNRMTFHEEIKALSKNSRRHYIDMLLDVDPVGYESVALWNISQRENKVGNLIKCVNLQSGTDDINHAITLNYFLVLLQASALEGAPYTEVINTQVMSIPALCDVIIEYNQWIVNKGINAPQILIHQYLTDVATQGAISFFKPLSRLTHEQQNQMKLYGLGLDENTIKFYFPKGNQFNAIYDISGKDNPMVRSAFKEERWDNSSNYYKETRIDLRGKESAYIIQPAEQIAAIMLGSQANDDTAMYLERLLESGMNKVFVFGGEKPRIKVGIEQIIQEHPEYADKIIPLGFQDDKAVAPLMSRCNVLIIGGGGLTVMEQLAMNHHPEQAILIHYPEHAEEGIIWEGKNVDYLIAHLNKIGLYSGKISLEGSERQLAEARLIVAAKKIINEYPYGKRHIKGLSDIHLAFYLGLLKEDEKNSSSLLLTGLRVFFARCEKKNPDFFSSKNNKRKVIDGQRNHPDDIFPIGPPS